MNEHRYILKQKTDGSQFVAYLLYTFQYTLGLSRRRFFIAIDVLSQKALIHSYSFRKGFCINNFVKLKKLFWIECDNEQDILINEVTGERITAEELETRKQAAGSKTICFIVLRTDSRDEPIE